MRVKDRWRHQPRVKGQGIICSITRINKKNRLSRYTIQKDITREWLYCNIWNSSSKIGKKNRNINKIKSNRSIEMQLSPNRQKMLIISHCRVSGLSHSLRPLQQSRLDRTKDPNLATHQPGSNLQMQWSFKKQVRTTIFKVQEQQLLIKDKLWENWQLDRPWTLTHPVGKA